MISREVAGDGGGDGLQLTGEKKQQVWGFGACFNELGWDALQKADSKEHAAFMEELFGAKGCRFNLGRVPIGANDFSLGWYSCDETDEDYKLRDFSIDRDRKYTFPFVREAMRHCPGLFLFASPWSPPTWMKTKKVCNYGRIRMEDKVLDAYARYFLRFVEEYEKEGIRIEQIHIQNEPMADQKFPSCLWYGEDMRDFIKSHLGPVFEKASRNTEIWLGTINGPFVDFRWPGVGAPYCDFFDLSSNTVLSDREARKYISGVGVQWGGKHQLEQITASYPEMRIMQTESECGDGLNEWEQAEYVFTLMWQYFRHGAERYAYWNIALLEDGISSWGWRQNSLCTVDSTTGHITLQPEFYLMKHFSHYIDSGAQVLGVSGPWSANSIAFENPNGDLILVVGNGLNRDREFTFHHAGVHFTTTIGARTINTLIIARSEQEKAL